MSLKACYLAENEDGRALEPQALGVGGKVGDGREHSALVIAACILDSDYRQRWAEARFEQLLGDRPGGADAHIDEQRVLAARQRGQIEMLEGRLLATGLMARQEGHGVRHVAMGERDLQTRRCGNACGHTGYDLDGDAGSA